MIVSAPQNAEISNSDGSAHSASLPALRPRVGREGVVLAGPRRRLPRPAGLVGYRGGGGAAALMDAGVMCGAGSLRPSHGGVCAAAKDFEAVVGLCSVKNLLFRSVGLNGLNAHLNGYHLERFALNFAFDHSKG